MTHTAAATSSVVAINIAPGRRLPMKAVDTIVAEAGLGLVGDRYHGSRDRHVSIQSASQLAEGAEILGQPIAASGTRRNITISVGEIPYEGGRRITVGPVVLEVFRMAAPCRLLDDGIDRGAATALRRRAGSLCRIINGGPIQLGDPVDLDPRPAAGGDQDPRAALEGLGPEDGSPVAPELIPAALTAGILQFEDGASQVFSSDGATIYSEHGRATAGTWHVEGQAFCSFWPPSYTGCYDVTWLVEDARITGLCFIDQQSGDRFIGRYE